MPSSKILIEVARLHFDEGLKQSQIAGRLLKDELVLKAPTKKTIGEWTDQAGSWLLKREARLAEIERRDLDEPLARELCRTFGLKDARVVNGGHTKDQHEHDELTHRYARAAAECFDDLTGNITDPKDARQVSVSGSQVILEMMSALPERKRTHVHFWAGCLLGSGRMFKIPHVGPQTTATIGWSRSGKLAGHLYYGTVPPYEFLPGQFIGLHGKEKHEAVRKEVQKQLKRHSESLPISQILDDMSENINMAVTGLGSINPTYAGNQEERSMTAFLKTFGIDLDLLETEGAAGDFGYCMFDHQGKGNPKWNFFLTPGYPNGVDFYRKLVANGKPVIVITGPNKVSAVRAALAGPEPLLNILITDQVTAKALLA